MIESELYNQFMNEKVVVQLIRAANNHYWHIANGGSGVGRVENVNVEGQRYRWMGSDLETKEKYTAYLKEVTTPEQSAAYWQKEVANGSIREINGKLAQPDADGGSLRDWNASKATLIKDGTTQKTYTLIVPLGDSGDHEVHEVTVKLVDGTGWRIDETLDFIKS
ncbi:DL-endopeptidase inhibitor IseA family protein [Paenibacillus sp. N3.4]|uniref:DL-endopeptidase inhibitor IseA family protein n=1 Tax=Paenibacillus sp. N3.4 TaxID=2603222 RepID=UPI00164F1E0E|nr:DL-endopeptidase inhibitor IseA family protein [Paenibacillus sp. N3.4]